MLVELTNAQALDVAEAWAHYRKDWKEQADLFLAAFIHKNRLYCPGAATEASSESMTAEARAKALRIIELMRGIRPSVHVNRLKLT